MRGSAGWQAGRGEMASTGSAVVMKARTRISVPQSGQSSGKTS